MKNSSKSIILILLLCFCVLATSFPRGLVSYCYAQDASKEEESLFVAKKAFEDGFYDVSLGLLERFLKNYPNSSKNSQVELLIGECYFHQNKFLDALEKFTSLIDKPNSKDIKDEIYYWIAEVHFKGNNFAKSAEYYQKIVDSYPKSAYLPASYYSLGWSQFQDKIFDKALLNFLTVEEKFPKESYAQDASLKIIECLYNLKEYSRLKDKIKNYLKIYSKDVQKVPYFYYYLAESDYYLNNFEAALEEYTKAFSLTRDDKIQTMCRLGMAWSNLRLKKYAEAEKNFSEIEISGLENSVLSVLLLGKAEIKVETKAFAQAEVIYRQLIEVAADKALQVQGYLGLAESLYNLGEYKKAEDIYRESIDKINGDIPEEIVDKLHYGLAWVYLKEGNFKQAIEEFKRTAKVSDDKVIKVSALCQIGDAYQDSGEYNKAIETYDSILKNYPDNFYADYVQYQLGLTFLKLSNYDAAIIAFKTLKANFPSSKLDDDASYAIGLTYFQKQDYLASKDFFESFEKEYKDSSLRQQALYLLGSSLYNLSKFQEAIDVFKNIVRFYSHDTEICQKAEYEIADCLYRMGNEKEAMSRFKLLRAKYPDSSLTPEVMWWLGEYYYRHNDLNLARRYFSSLIQDFSKSNLVSDAYYALGASYAEETKYDEAILNFKKVIELGKSDLSATAAIAIADIYLKQELYDQALDTYKEVLNNSQNLTHLIYPKIADLYYNMGNFDEALNYYKKSLDLVPAREMSSIQFRIAECRQAQGNINEAIEEYLKTSYVYAENNDLMVKALLRVAAIYEDKDNFKEALKIYKRISSFAVPEAKFANEKIDSLKLKVR